MRLDIVTLFPEMVEAALAHSIVKRARERGLITIRVVNLRDYTTDRHKTADDLPYGGGGGMILKVEPIARALAALTAPPSSQNESSTSLSMRPERVEETGKHGGAETVAARPAKNETQTAGVPSIGQDAANLSDDFPMDEIGNVPSGARIILTDPRGERFTQALAERWAREPHLILLCGHYEGVDERVRQHLVTNEVSVGDYILTGGELPALLIVDALTRLQPGALGDEFGAERDTFGENLLEYPHYTRPAEFQGWAVPDVLLSGHHAQVARWRRWHQLHATRERRPDLFARLQPGPQDEKLLNAEEPQALPETKPGRAREPKRADDARTEAAGNAAMNTINQTMNALHQATNKTTFEKSEENDGAGTGNDTGN